MGRAPRQQYRPVARSTTTTEQDQDEEEYSLGATEAGKLLHVGPKRVSSLASEGKLPHETTPGGHRRYRASDILAFKAATKADREHQRQKIREQFHGNGKP